ncbi:hypothetical protein PG993_006099 [Apiospora rasikravindrae]|uniref:Uncharacterized protein n=1 Tax=Apiospora rasikravindrae TaxID=990691 RepID=A0ABR1TD19_9PEZI
MAGSHQTNDLPAEFVQRMESFLEQPHSDWGDATILSTIRSIVADELWGGYHVEMSALDPGFVMSYSNSRNSGFEIAHDEEDADLFRNASYKVPLITVTPGEREQDWAMPQEETHGLTINRLLRCVSVMRVGNDSGVWWGRYIYPPLRSEEGDYLAIMFVLGREGEKRKMKYFFPPMKVLQRSTTIPGGEVSWIGLDVPQKRDLETLRDEMAEYERQYNESVEESAKSAMEKARDEEDQRVRKEYLISRVESWLESLSIEDGHEGGRRRGRMGCGRGRGRGGTGRTLYEPNENSRNQQRRGRQRDGKMTTGSKGKQPTQRQVLKRNASPEKPVVLQILKRPVGP